jgi:predicted phosphodiesterase
MRYAIVSDIHANLRAWDAVLADIRSQGADVIICLGDVVGYGPKPAEVLEAVRAETSHFVLGNHDAAAAGMMDYSIFNEHAQQAIEWTMTELTPEATTFLASLPLAIEAGEILFVHAEIAEPGRFDYIDSPDMAQENFAANKHFVTFVGHTHQPKIFECGEEGTVRELVDQTCSLDPDKRYIVNVGSVGEPRNSDDLRARYVIYNSETREVDFRRVEFDIVAYRADLEATTLALRPYFLRVFEHVVEGREVVVSTAGSLVDMQVAHDSAALVDLGHASPIVHMQLASARQSRGPAIILTAAAVLTLAVLGIWALASGSAKDSREKQSNRAVISTEEKMKSPPKKPKAGKMPPAPEEPRMAKGEAPETSGPEPEPEPEPKPKPKKTEPLPPAKPQPKPKPKPPKQPLKVASWRMDQGAEGTPLVDESGQVELLPVANGTTIRAVAPDPVPLTQKENKSALQVGIWKEEKAGSVFGLTSTQSFTFEGWFLTEKLRRPIFLLGTRTGDEDKTGWHLDLRPPSGGQREGQMSFFYDSGSNRIQALAEAVTIADLKPHHFAVIWDHDASRESGEMKLYLDGAEVAVASLPLTEIVDKQLNPFRIGAKGNPERLALDELRFTRRALAPREFLLKPPILGIKMVQSDPVSRDSWGTRDNWEGKQIPGGDDSVIIEEGLTAQAQNSPPNPYTGSLVLKKDASLILWENEALTALPKAPSILVMHEDSRLVLRTGTATLGPIELKEDAQIWGGASTNGHGAVRHFKGEIKGAGKLTLNGVRQNQIRIEAANTFTGGFLAHSTQNQAFLVFASSNQAFGKGDVSIKETCSLIIEQNTGDTIADSATLRLDGPGVLRIHGNDTKVYKLLLNSNETVAGFCIDGKDLGEGIYSSETHPEIGGSGKLTVKPANDE